MTGATAPAEYCQLPFKSTVSRLIEQLIRFVFSKTAVTAIVDDPYNEVFPPASAVRWYVSSHIFLGGY